MKIVSVCACTSGIAHTYIAKEKLIRAAESMGHTIKLQEQKDLKENLRSKFLQMFV